MSDETTIEPALSAEEWKAALDNEFVMQDMAKRFATGREGTTVGLIALLNATLPDTDPRKITREWVEHIRDYGGSIPEPGSYGDEHDEEAKRILYGIAAALASYLPPETG